MEPFSQRSARLLPETMDNLTSLFSRSRHDQALGFQPGPVAEGDENCPARKRPKMDAQEAVAYDVPLENSAIIQRLETTAALV